MITVSGNTRAYVGVLKAYGGRWNHEIKMWCFDSLKTYEIDELRSLIGLIVADDKPPKIETRIYGDDPTYFNYFRDKDPFAFFGFSSLRKFADYVETLQRPPDDGRTTDIAWRTETGRRGKDMFDFTGTRDLPEAISLARNGWSDGLSLAHKFDIPHALNKRRTPSMIGGTVNVGRLLAGNPVHMIKRKKAPKNRIITLFVDCMMWHGIEKINAIMRALIIAGMVDVLETEGYICNIVAVSNSYKVPVGWSLNLKPGVQLAVTIKQAGERTNLMDISFALGHPAFLRRLEFAVAGSIPEMEQSDKRSAIVSEAFDDDYPCGPNEYYIPSLSPEAQSRIQETGNLLDMLDFIEPANLPIKIRSE